MVDEEPPADRRSGVNLDPSEETIKLGEETTDEAESMPPKEVSETMKPQGVQSWIAEDDLQGVSRRRVFGKNRPQVLSKDTKGISQLHYLQKAGCLDSAPRCRAVLPR